MKFINDYTGEVFDTAEECQKSEKDFLEKKKAKELKEKEAEEYWAKAVEAMENYLKAAYGEDISEKEEKKHDKITVSNSTPKEKIKISFVDDKDDSFEEFLKYFFS